MFSSLGKIEYKLEIIEEIKNAKILVVDDIKTNCDVLKRRLESNEFIVDISMSGKEALEKINQQKYDLILLDCEPQLIRQPIAHLRYSCSLLTEHPIKPIRLKERNLHRKAYFGRFDTHQQ